jgi:hypothetical protein
MLQFQVKHGNCSTALRKPRSQNFLKFDDKVSFCKDVAQRLFCFNGGKKKHNKLQVHLISPPFLFSILVFHCHTNWSSDEPVSGQKKKVHYLASEYYFINELHLTIYSFLGHFKMVYQQQWRCNAK